MMFRLFRVLKDTNRRFGAELEEIFLRESQDFSKLHSAIAQAVVKQGMNEGGERTFEAFIATRKSVEQTEKNDQQKEELLVEIYRARDKAYRVTRRD